MKRKNIVLIVLGIIVILIAVIIIAANSNRSEIHSYSVNVTDANNVSVETTTQLHETEVPDGYVGIYTVDDFEYIRTNPSYNYILMNDIDFSGVTEWKAPDIESIFDGNNYTINNYKQDVPLFDKCVGLIQDLNMKNFDITAGASICNEIYSNSTSKNVGIVNCVARGKIQYSLYKDLSNIEKSLNLSGARNIIDASRAKIFIGGLVGKIRNNNADNPIVENCCFIGTIDILFNFNELEKNYYIENSMPIYVGGIAGSVVDCKISKCKTSGEISFNKSNDVINEHCLGRIGGIFGGITGVSSIKQSKNEINISSNCGGSRIGGIVGEIRQQDENLIIREACNTGNIVSTDKSSLNHGAGIVGANNGYYMPFMYDCYNAGNISASNAAGLSSSSAIISGCYNVGTISGTDKAGAITADKSEQIEYSYFLDNSVDVTGVGGKYPYVKALSEEEMKNQSSFEWMNFNDVWTFSDGDYKYPTLINCP